MVNTKINTFSELPLFFKYLLPQSDILVVGRIQEIVSQFADQAIRVDNQTIKTDLNDCLNNLKPFPSFIKFVFFGKR